MFVFCGAEGPIHSERQGRVVVQNGHKDLWNDHLAQNAAGSPAATSTSKHSQLSHVLWCVSRREWGDGMMIPLAVYFSIIFPSIPYVKKTPDLSHLSHLNLRKKHVSFSSTKWDVPNLFWLMIWRGLSIWNYPFGCRNQTEHPFLFINKQNGNTPKSSVFCWLFHSQPSSYWATHLWNPHPDIMINRLRGIVYIYIYTSHNSNP